MQSGTFMFSLYTFIRNHPWLSAIIGVTAAVQVTELILMNRKFGLFTPSFLQPYSIDTFLDRVLFFIATVYSDLLLFGAISVFFMLIAVLLKKSQIVFAYHFFFIVITISLLAVIAKYKVLSYMSDTINFTIAKNIAGGSILSAMSYVADEAAIMLSSLFMALILYWVGYKVVQGKVQRGVCPERATGTIPFRRIVYSYGGLFIGFVFVAVMILRYDNVRYGVEKKNSYALLTAVLDSLSDFDQDGYGYFSFPEDLAMFDAAIHPGAVDIPGNDVDEDMLLGDFKLKDVDYDLDYSNVVPVFDYVFFIILESARADVLETKVNNHIVSPNLLRMSQQGTVFPNAYSHTGFTASSLKAIFNGELISPLHQLSLFEILKKIGYEVNVISGQAESFANISQETNMRATAAHFFDAETNIEERVYANTSLGSLRLSEEVVVRAINSQLDTLKGRGKQFFYINIQAAHFPYHYEGMKNLLNIAPIPRSQISLTNKTWLENTYWNAVAAADDALGQLLSRLHMLGIYDRSLIVVTADHGESLFDDGVLGHGHRINDQQLKVPLVTNVQIEPITKPIGQTDIRELLLDLIGQDTDMALTNRKLAGRRAVFHVIGGISSPVQISHTYSDDRLVFDFRTRKVMFESTGRWLLIDDVVEQPSELEMLRELVFEWEKLNYRNSMEQLPELPEGRLVHSH